MANGSRSIAYGLRGAIKAIGEHPADLIRRLLLEYRWRDMIEDGTQLQTEAAVSRQQRITGHCGAYLAIAQDEMREHGGIGNI
jgi:hypothetical protein